MLDAGRNVMTNTSIAMELPLFGRRSTCFTAARIPTSSSTTATMRGSSKLSTLGMQL